MASVDSPSPGPVRGEPVSSVRAELVEARASARERPPAVALPTTDAFTPRLGRAWWKGRPKLYVFGGVIAFMTLVGLLAPFIAPYAPIKTMPADALQPPSSLHWMGTDQ